eukprot:2804708-Rhodomonas_salina.1
MSANISAATQRAASVPGMAKRASGDGNRDLEAQRQAKPRKGRGEKSENSGLKVTEANATRVLLLQTCTVGKWQ